MLGAEGPHSPGLDRTRFARVRKQGVDADLFLARAGDEGAEGEKDRKIGNESDRAGGQSEGPGNTDRPRILEDAYRQNAASIPAIAPGALPSFVKIPR